MAHYPTKEEILAQAEEIPAEVINLTIDWKKDIWKYAKKGTPFEKREALSLFLKNLNQAYGTEFKIRFQEGLPSGMFSREHLTIYMNDYSIITLLHEFAHGLYGASELKACTWSITLFKLSFPKAFQKLKWEGHLLKK